MNLQTKKLSSLSFLGLDIGGANLKAADTDGRAASRRFEIWQAPGQLDEELAALVRHFPPATGWAVTMTAELADCFTSKTEGVAAVIEAAQRVADGTPLQIWRTRGGFTTPEDALRESLKVAAANWHALADWAAGHFGVECGLLIDIGSTTTDIIPLKNRHAAPAGFTDVQRLQSSELVYSGYRRTPLCALAAAVPYRGEFCPLAAEWFATTQDVYHLLGELEEHPADSRTADGRPATAEQAHARMARMLCCDCTEFSREDAETAARYLADAQRDVIAAAVRRVCESQSGSCRTVIVSGSGSSLAMRVMRGIEPLKDCRVISLAEEFSPPIAESACAYAVACLVKQSAVMP